ncbi:MAG: hypothetical protein LBK50_03550 [Candidatus Nomurabacteria bacterium]|jgi:hypothetical protein|nr:hypothetical protein [Candidatus Nomurabacteria bacterium]
MIGVSIGNSANSASPSGTSIPVKKGGTGATTASDAIQNLLPDFASNNGKVLGSTGTTIQWVDQNNPEIQSSNDTGKVKIDDTAKTMTVNGEIAVSSGTVYSINRPDEWPLNTELDFGNGLYGRRYTGTITTNAGKFVETLGNQAIASFVSTNGGLQIGTHKVPVPYLDFAGGSKALLTVAQVHSDDGVFVLTTLFNDNVSGVPYDVWVTYRK